ncbi:MAG: alpha/beta fold hydrolase [Verrucomicrobia bacterium]|nr:alpha/beta fold hydrolase [Verrucomicrobiota bacterium]
MIFAVCVAVVDHASAIQEQGYGPNYAGTVLPFLSSGERFSFRSADGVTNLQGIRFLHPVAKGMIVVLNGSTESWLKYGELFYDLYHHGYSVISYDHRGQGLSPHLVRANSQIAQIDNFDLYAADLNALIQQVIMPGNHEKLYLLAHSMGGGVALDYLERYSSPFQAVVLSAPMLRINTAPYPESLAHLVVKLSCIMGLGDRYSIGMHDHDPKEPFEGNKITSSKERWEAIQHVWQNHPEAVLGGPSNDWVDQTMNRTPTIRKHLSTIDSRILILQAGRDQFVMNPDQVVASTQIPRARLVTFPDSKHEILTERDPIRDRAIGQILEFFNN